MLSNIGQRIRRLQGSENTMRLVFKKKFIILLFIWLCRVLAEECGIFSCGMWDLVPRQGIEPRSPVLGARIFSHWTTTLRLVLTKEIYTVGRQLGIYRKLMVMKWECCWQQQLLLLPVVLGPFALRQPLGLTNNSGGGRTPYIEILGFLLI